MPDLNRAALAVLAAALLACSGCDDAGERANEDPARADESVFVGGEACAGCHAEEAARWAGSHHDLAMQSATAQTVLGDFDGRQFVYDGVTTSFSLRGGEYWVTTDGPDGRLQDFRITHTFGVTPLQQYLVELSGGRYQALSIAWDARPAEQGGQRWFHLYPDDAIDFSDPLHWTRTAQSWNTNCAACHSTGLIKSYDSASHAFATTWESMDVDCEACHGPGSAHAAAPAEVGIALAQDPHSWILAPQASIAERVPALTDDEQLEVCAQCHSRRAQIRDANDAAEPLLENFIPALLDEGLYHSDGQILGEVFVYGSFVQSAMHHAGVTCSDCHDPHSAELRAEGNAVCGQCHAATVFDTPQHHHHDTGSAGSACVDCHMRAETYMVVDPRRDHSFRVPRPDLSAELGTPNACSDCHREEGVAWAAARVEEWYPDGRSDRFHYGHALHAGRSWSADRVPLLRRVVEDEAMPGIARATAVELLAEQMDAAAFEIVERALEDGDELVRLAALRALGSVPPELRVELAQRFLTDRLRALRTSAALLLLPARDLLSERRRSDLDAALDEYSSTLQFNADRPEGLTTLADLLAATDDPRAAEDLYRQAIEREPSFAPAYANLADLYRRLGREPEAEAELRAGLKVIPDDAGLHLALGLSLVRSGRLAEALPVLERASKLAPDEPQHRYLWGVALDSADDRERALDVLSAAADRFPGHVPTLFALATMHRDAGRTEKALAYTRQLLELSPSNAEARALLRELSR